MYPGTLCLVLGLLLFPSSLTASVVTGRVSFKAGLLTCTLQNGQHFDAYKSYSDPKELLVTIAGHPGYGWEAKLSKSSPLSFRTLVKIGGPIAEEWVYGHDSNQWYIMHKHDSSRNLKYDLTISDDGRTVHVLDDSGISRAQIDASARLILASSVTYPTVPETYNFQYDSEFFPSSQIIMNVCFLDALQMVRMVHRPLPSVSTFRPSPVSSPAPRRRIRSDLAGSTAYSTKASSPSKIPEKVIESFLGPNPFSSPFTDLASSLDHEAIQKWVNSAVSYPPSEIPLDEYDESSSVIHSIAPARPSTTSSHSISPATQARATYPPTCTPMARKAQYDGSVKFKHETIGFYSQRRGVSRFDVTDNIPKNPESQSLGESILRHTEEEQTAQVCPSVSNEEENVEERDDCPQSHRWSAISQRLPHPQTNLAPPSTPFMNSIDHAEDNILIVVPHQVSNMHVHETLSPDHRSNDESRPSVNARAILNSEIQAVPEIVEVLPSQPEAHPQLDGVADRNEVFIPTLTDGIYVAAGVVHISNDKGFAQLVYSHGERVKDIIATRLSASNVEVQDQEAKTKVSLQLTENKETSSKKITLQQSGLSEFNYPSFTVFGEIIMITLNKFSNRVNQTPMLAKLTQNGRLLEIFQGNDRVANIKVPNHGCPMNLAGIITGCRSPTKYEFKVFREIPVQVIMDICFLDAFLLSNLPPNPAGDAPASNSVKKSFWQRLFGQ